MADHSLNLIDVDLMVEDFLQKNQVGITTMHQMYFKTSNKISLNATIELLKKELRTGCTSFINKTSTIDGLQNYLFYIANSFCKKFSYAENKKKSEYICPGCLFLGITTTIFFDKTFQCEECLNQLKTATDPKQMSFYKTFAIHNKQGYRCPDCKRFLPHPLETSSTILCPYFDCYFVGECKDLHKMHHTTLQTNPEKLILDITNDGQRSYKDSLVSEEIIAQASLEVKEDLLMKVGLIQEVINSQLNQVAYNGSDFTIKHKQFVYESFGILLQKYPEEMVAYLLDGSRSGGFQHKVFQEYIRLLEESLPFFIKKGNKRYRVDTLLSQHLCVFDGISVFNSIITDKLDIKNETVEFYIGGRKAAYTQPYYIGKLLNIIHAETKDTILSLVKEYSFSRIKLRDIKPGTPVTVTHLRIPPHYQMGGMVYVNRVRKKIVERAQALLKKDNHVL